MSTHATSTDSVRGCRAVSAKDVLAIRYGFKVFRINAPSITAQMIDREAARNLPVRQRVADSMRPILSWF